MNQWLEWDNRVPIFQTNPQVDILFGWGEMQDANFGYLWTMFYNWDFFGTMKSHLSVYIYIYVFTGKPPKT